MTELTLADLLDDKRYLDALERLWNLDCPGIIEHLPSAGRDSTPHTWLQELVFKACQQAAAARRNASSWKEKWFGQGYSPPPSLVVSSADEDEEDAMRHRARRRIVLAAHLKLVEFLKSRPDDRHLNMAELERCRDEVKSLARSADDADDMEGLCTCFLRDLSSGMLSSPITPAKAQQEVQVVLEYLDERRCVEATLTVELVHQATTHESGLYPHPEAAFVCWNDEFRTAYLDAWSFVRHQLSQEGAPAPNVCVRWCLRNNDGEPLTPLAGRSAGGAFAVSLLLAGRQAACVQPR